jgi:formate--tetrahydrofolate ligase
VNGIPREEHFLITAASEIMAILCLAADMEDLKERLGYIIIGYTRKGDVVFAHQLKAAGAMAALLKDAVKPNLVQTLENTPCLIHGGPFANIAHGCNSLRATKLALRLADYTITEAGFGSDLGAEKFLDIKCRYGDLTPDAVVLVATVRALKYNGGVPKDKCGIPDTGALKAGLPNLAAHIENMQKFGLPVIVAINHFATDTEEETAVIRKLCEEMQADVVVSEVFAKGGEGGRLLAEKVIAACEKPNAFRYLYDLTMPVKEKIETIATKIYGADKVVYSLASEAAIREIESLGCAGHPVCIAKTQYSLSDDPAKLGRPAGFDIHAENIRLYNGAGFIVVETGDIMTMPGLSAKPAAEQIAIDGNGKITGLF